MLINDGIIGGENLSCPHFTGSYSPYEATGVLCSIMATLPTALWSDSHRERMFYIEVPHKTYMTGHALEFAFIFQNYFALRLNS